MHLGMPNCGQTPCENSWSWGCSVFWLYSIAWLYTLPETNKSHLKLWGLIQMSFLLGLYTASCQVRTLSFGECIIYTYLIIIDPIWRAYSSIPGSNRHQLYSYIIYVHLPPSDPPTSSTHPLVVSWGLWAASVRSGHEKPIGGRHWIPEKCPVALAEFPPWDSGCCT